MTATEDVFVFPLSFSQQRLWLWDQLEPGSSAYNIPAVVSLEGGLNAPVLEQSVNEIVRRHESLRTVFMTVEGQPAQVVHSTFDFALALVDLSGLPDQERKAAAQLLASREARRPFDLSRDSLFRAGLLRLDPAESWLLLTMHHIVSDGWSIGILTREMSALYRAFSTGAASPLPDLQIQYADFALWQRSLAESDALNESLAYWKRHLSGAPPVLELPTDRPRPAIQTYRGDRVSLTLSGELTEALKALSRRYGVTLFTTLLAAFKALLSRQTGCEDIVVGVPIAGRNRIETEGFIGFFVNTLALRADLSGDPSFHELLDQVREVVLETHTHQDLPFEKLVEELQPERSLSHTPIFQVMFNMLSFPDERIELPNLAVKITAVPEQPSKFDLTLYARDGSEGLVFELVYNADLFDKERMQELCEQLKRLLAQIVADPDQRITSFSLITERVKSLLPDPREPLNCGWEGPVTARFSEQARRFPGKLAIVDDSETWDYRELDYASNRLANCLLANGIKRNEVIAIYGDRSGLLVCALLGVLKAGAAFVILDPAYPAQRLIDCVSAADPAGWIHLEAAGPLPESLLSFVNGSSSRCFLELPRSRDASRQSFLCDYSSDDPNIEVRPDDSAYVAFTSGSTGKPRGVLGAHRPLSHFFRWYCEEFNVTERDRFSVLSGVSHDPLLRDVFAPLWLGATLLIPDQERLGDPGWLAEWIRRQEISVIHLTPALGQVLTTGAAPIESTRPLTSLRYAFFGGDTLTKRHVAELSGIAPGVTCVNFYGATETPQAKAYFIVQGQRSHCGDITASKEDIPLGRGIKDVQLILLNGAGELCGVGELGEIHVRSPYLAVGYVKDDDATSKRFIDNPFTGLAGDRLYKTGDLGRYSPDGSVRFAGRIDGQVKIRGFRVEPGEVEAALAEHSGVQDVVVVADLDSSSCGRLVAYVVARNGTSLPAAELRRFVASKLPDYMVPSSFALLDSLPLTPNGKVDRRALPNTEQAQDPTDRAYRSPRSPVEEMLARLWAELLRSERIGIDDNFFELGGHSLLATQVVARIEETFGVRLSLRSMFEHPTIADLASVIEAGGDTSGLRPQDSLPVIEPDPARRYLPFPLTDIQQAYWIGRSEAFELGNVASHRYLEFEGAGIDLDRFTIAWRRLIERHDMLRAVVRSDGQQQILQGTPPYEIETLDLRGQDPHVVADQLETIREKMSHQALPSHKWPLFEIKACRLDGGRARLHFSFDYLLADARSFQILARELSELYQNPESSLAPLEISFREYVLAERAIEESSLYKGSLDYWQGRLSGLPPAPELPLAKSPAAARPRFVRRSARLERENWDRLKAWAARAGLTPSGVLLAAFSDVLTTWSKRPQFSIVLTLFNRHPLHPQVNGLIGDFTSTVLLAIDNSGQDTFEARARRIQEQLWEDLDHRYVSGVRVLRDLARTRGGASEAAMPVVFTSTLNLSAPGRDLPYLAEIGEIVYSITQTPQVMLDHQVSENGGVLTFNWDAVEDAFPEGLLDDMFEAYCGHIRWLAYDQSAWRQVLRELTPDSQLEVRAAVNATEAQISTELLHTLFLRQVVRRPGELAVISSGRTLTYEELLRRSYHVSRLLRKRGARPNSLVAVVMEKGWEQIVAALGILQSGAAYVPIDAGLPKERIQYLLDNSEASLVLTQSWIGAAPDWPDGVCRICVDEEESQELDDDVFEPAQRPEDLAYVIYTSGSTGMPKGVMIDHRGAVNTILDLNERFQIGPEDRVLALSSLSFDLSVYDIFGILAAGGTIVIPEASATRDPAHWAALIARENVTLWNSVPTLMEMLVEHLEGSHEALPESLRLVFMSGDWIPVTLPDRIRALGGPVSVIGMGGATEASIWSILYPIERVAPGWTSIPYGRPMINQTFHVLDELLEPRPVLVPGQLYIGGIGLAKGYWRNEEKTRASFIVHPRTGERLYRTGDLGRYLPDCNIEFLGREDFQVKIQGHRIELGEIETALIKHPAVTSAVVTAAGSTRGPKRLVAYVVADHDQAPASGDLNAFLREKLPAYMVPSAFVFLDALPLTSNGKVDRRSLPDPDPVEQEHRSYYEPPRTPVEEEIARLFSELLGVERVGVNDDFFALGGNSVAAVRLVSAVRKLFQVELPLRNVFESPTVAGLAVAVLQNQSAQIDDEELNKMLAELDQFSDEEIQKLLSEELEQVQS